MRNTPSRVIPIRALTPAAVSAGAAERTAKSSLTSTKSSPKIYPRAVHGWFAGWRWAMVWLTQLVFYGLPWLQWNGRQAVLFDPTQRRFQIFGLLLQTAGFHLPWPRCWSSQHSPCSSSPRWPGASGVAMPARKPSTPKFSCGWSAVPKGDRPPACVSTAARGRPAKIARKGSKQTIWILISLFTGFSFVGYFTPIRTLASEAAALSFSPWEWFWVLFYGFATYGNAGYLREQMCKFICPYARFQSALIDKDSMVIAYDSARGDPRGGRSRKADRNTLALGDCLDCKLCVHVCPTGIDIFATACRTNASAARRASTPATM